MTAYPGIVPASKIGRIVLPQYATVSMVNTEESPLPLGVYADDETFLQGCADQVAIVWAALGGAVLDIELTPYLVFSMYEQAVLDYSAIINSHHAKNVFSSILGTTGGNFDSDGNLVGDGTDGNLAAGSHVELKYPKFDFGYSMRIADAVSTMADIGGNEEMYKVNVPMLFGKQDYDLQEIIETAAEDPESPFHSKFDGIQTKTKVLIKKVYFQSPRTMWQFYGYFGGLNVMGNLNTYGMWSDDAQYQIVPVWQNRLQAMSFKESMSVRTAHFSYRIINNVIRLFPVPDGVFPPNVWIEFLFPTNVWGDDGSGVSGVDGVNNFNTIPFENIPYTKIHSMGKTWIRKYATALCKTVLGNIRSKVGQIPIPGQNVTLNGPSLLAEGKEELRQLVEDLKKLLDELSYAAAAKADKEQISDAREIMASIPLPIYVG
jgi:hypothetical protein